MLKGLLILPAITTDLTLPFRVLPHPAGLAAHSGQCKHDHFASSPALLEKLP